MSYLLKSALGYLGGAAASVGQENDFVGQYVELGSQKLRVKRVIAEGVLCITRLRHYNSESCKANAFVCWVVFLYGPPTNCYVAYTDKT